MLSNYLKNGGDHRMAKGRRETRALQLFEQNLQRVESGVSKINGSPLVAVEIEQRGRVFLGSALQIRGVIAGRDHFGNERVEPLQLVFVQGMPVGDHMMASSSTAGKELDQIVALTKNTRLRIHSVIGNHCQRGMRSQGARFNGGPNASEQRIDSLQG